MSNHHNVMFAANEDAAVAIAANEGAAVATAANEGAAVATIDLSDDDFEDPSGKVRSSGKLNCIL